MLIYLMIMIMINLEELLFCISDLCFLIISADLLRENNSET